MNFLNPLYLEFYRIFYPVFLFIVKLFSPYNKKLKKGFRMREDKNRVPPWLNFIDIKDPILIHCASGEFEYAKPVIREIKKRNPNASIVVTYFSPSYESQIKNTEGIDFSCPLPWDLPHVQREFLTKLQPKQILISRTDLWPEFLYQAQSLKIPISMFSTTLSAKSSKIQNVFLKSYQRWLFSFLTHVYCVSDDDKINLSQLIDPRKITVIGDTRFDQVIYRISKPNRLKDNLLAKKETRMTSVFIAGSTWSEDEAEIVPIFKELIRNGIQVIIAPHEPSEEHIDKLKNDFINQGVRSVLYSEANLWPHNQVLIIDQVGILADLYAWADWAFVGGSFKKQVHSVMEPLAQGCKTYFGPYHINNREALMFKSLGYATSIHSGQQMLELMLNNRNMDTSQSYKEGLKQAIHTKAGASETLILKLFS
jgi:3-deoxy-D-manno-octulosonic-acid transferase